MDYKTMLLIRFAVSLTGGIAGALLAMWVFKVL